MMPNNAHWFRSSSSKACQLHTDSLTGKILHQSKGHDDSLALDQVKSKEFKLVRVDMNQRYSFGGKGKSGETSEVDRGKFKVMENFSMRRNVGLINDETAFSEKVSTQHLTESSIKWKKSGSYCCHNLDISESDFEHFSMADINRKIETMSASKKKSAYGVVSVKMVKENLSLCESIGTSSLTAKKIICDAEKVMTTYEGFLPDNDDDMDGAPSPVIHGCKYQKTNMVDCMFSSGLTYADPLNNKLTCMQHNLCSCCSSSKAMRTGIKRRIGPISKGFGNSWTGLKGGSTHMLIESSPIDFHHSFSTEGHGSEVKGDSSRLRKPDGADVNHLPCKMAKCLKHDMNLPESCQNLKSVDIGERFHKFSSTKKYLLIADKGDEYQCLRKRAMGDAAFTRVNGSSSSKTITIPTKQNHGKKEKSTIPLENFVRDEDRSDWDDTGANLKAEHNEFYTKADTICIHPFHRSSSLLGEFFPRPQKGVTSSNQRYPMPSSASSQEFASRNVAAGMANKREIEQSASTDKANYASHKEASVSRTESLAADHIVSHFKPSDHTSGSETWSSWIKRFQQNHSETLPLCTKRFKKDDDSSSGEVQETFSGMQNHNPSSYGSRRFMKEQGKCEKAMALSDESAQLWTRRWCRKHNEVSQTTSTRPSEPLTVHPEELRASLEKFEGKMPASIGAMALMGKAMNNYRPCRFWRDEGSLVWNTEE